MQNKCNCGCQQGFVPVSGNWDFNNKGDGCCQQGYTRRNRRNTCDECEQTYTRSHEREDDCQCERCNDSREVACCDQNTYIRDMDECEAACTRNCSKDWGCDKDDCGCTRNRSKDCGCDKDDCGYTRNRSNDCGCDKDDCGYARNRSKDCGCDKDNCGCEKKCGCKDNDNGSTYARSNKNRKVGMVNVQRQEIDEIFESESALRAGTLFPELHKPMNGYCPCDSNCGTCRQQAAFAAWELRLYLNTHPGDKEALKLFRKLCKEAEEPNYATSFLEDDGCANGWGWVKNPWPWEYDCQCGD